MPTKAEWEVIKTRYLRKGESGETSDSIASEYGICGGAIRKEASIKGWSIENFDKYVLGSVNETLESAQEIAKKAEQQQTKVIYQILEEAIEKGAQENNVSENLTPEEIKEIREQTKKEAFEQINTKILQDEDRMARLLRVTFYKKIYDIVEKGEVVDILNIGEAGEKHVRRGSAINDGSQYLSLIKGYEILEKMRTGKITTTNNTNFLLQNNFKLSEKKENEDEELTQNTIENLSFIEANKLKVELEKVVDSPCQIIDVIQEKNAN